MHAFHKNHEEDADGQGNECRGKKRLKVGFLVEIGKRKRCQHGDANRNEQKTDDADDGDEAHTLVEEFFDFANRFGQRKDDNTILRVDATQA
ncbi:MAG: hypothetical protein ACRDGA_05795, partial [Bacteroidota bacterium]